jgi:hypothetical protein
MESPRFIALFIRSCHFSLSWGRWIHPISLSFVSILFFHLCWSFQSGMFSFRSPYQNCVCISLLRPYVPHVLRILSSLFGDQNNMWWWLQIVKHLIMQFSPVCCVKYAVETVSWNNQWLKLYGVVCNLPPFIPTCESFSLTSWPPVCCMVRYHIVFVLCHCGLCGFM